MSQHMEALARANTMRLARAETKCKLRSGEVSAADLIDPDGEIPIEIGSMTVCELLCAQRQWGLTRARRAVLRPVGISETYRVDALTDRQRRLLVEALRGPARGSAELQVAA